METLFPLSPVFPKGFSYISNFLSLEEEERLLSAIADIDLHKFNFHGYEAKRKVASFGYDYSFTNRKLTKGREIPTAFDWLLRKVSDRLNLLPTHFGELLITEYPPGSVINWHRDAPPFDLIVGISLKENCIFRLRPYRKALQNRTSIIPVTVEKLSLYVISGEARTDWEHSTMPVKHTRYSITLRTLKT